MKLFESSKTFFPFIGLRPLKPNEKKFNLRNVGVLVSLGLFIISSSAFIYSDAQTLNEYAEAVFGWVSVFLFFIIFLNYVQKSDIIFRLIENFERIVNQRKKTKFI